MAFLTFSLQNVFMFKFLELNHIVFIIIEYSLAGICIILRKYAVSCIFCDSTKNLIDFDGRYVCPECAKKLAQKV